MLDLTAVNSGFQLSSMVATLSPSCKPLSQPNGEQRLRKCIEQVLADRCQLSVPHQAPLQTAPAAAPSEPANTDTKQALLYRQGMMGSHHADQPWERCHHSDKDKASGQQHTDTCLPCLTLPVAAAYSMPVKAKPQQVLIAASKQLLQSEACKTEVLLKAHRADAAETCRGVVESEKPATAAQKPPKRRKLQIAAPSMAIAPSCKQEETERGSNDLSTDNPKKARSPVHSSQPISALRGLIKQMPPRKPRTRRSQSASSSQDAQAITSSFLNAAAEPSAPANTNQPHALRRYLSWPCMCTIVTSLVS